MGKPVPYEIRLVAYVRVPGSNRPALHDIVDTSRHNASHFTRAWLRNADVAAIGACTPGNWPDATQTWIVRPTAEELR